MIEFDKYEVLSFDCYGTLIDWESGLASELNLFLATHDIRIPEARILEIYGEIEAELEQGHFANYREILRGVIRELGVRLNFIPSSVEQDCLADSLCRWVPFPDTVQALQILKRNYQLAIISNTDNDLFARTNEHLKVEFNHVITSQSVGVYKPSFGIFRMAIAKIGVPANKIVHVAQSIYHDIVPAKKIGLTTVWVNRRRNTEGYGATPPLFGYADLEVPDLKSLISVIQLQI